MANILMLNTYLHGGAGHAAQRIMHALRKHHSEHEVNLLSAANTGFKWPFYAERLSFLPYERDKSVRFMFSPANFGKDLSRCEALQKADLLHLHWVNQGLLSIKGIGQLAALGKPIVWTLHDTWAFTGGCHILEGCIRYKQSCGLCPYLRKPAKNDLSNRVWKAKKAFYPKNIHYVTCSKWLKNTARQSSLLAESNIRDIPNPIDTERFAPMDKAQISAFRAKHGIDPAAKVLLFVSMKITDAHKGFRFLPEALKHLKSKHPELKLAIMVMGKNPNDAPLALPYPVHELGLLSNPSDIASTYAAADVFVTPSMADNLPNTVMEALACGTPVAAFRTGGIPEMAGHLSEGYIADQGDAADLAIGLAMLLNDNDLREKMRLAARQKALACYAEAVVAKQYADLYAAVLQAR